MNGWSMMIMMVTVTKNREHKRRNQKEWGIFNVSFVTFKNGVLFLETIWRNKSYSLKINGHCDAKVCVCVYDE